MVAIVARDTEPKTTEYRIFGPPGTGKTTEIKARMTREVEAGRSPKDIAVASFTKTAAQALVGKGLPIPSENVSTLHAAGYAALGGNAPIAENHIKEWNETNPDIAMSGASKNEDGDEFGRGERGLGDDLFNMVSLYRARLVPESSWPRRPREFHALWKEFKRSRGYIDYEDMIEIPYERGLPHPSNPKIAYFDEFQDFTASEARLVRHWGSFINEIYLAGDDDQCAIAGSQVLTINGYKSIESLNPSEDRLVSYDKMKSEMRWGYSGKTVKGYGFQMASRPYTGTVLEVTAGDKKTTVTPNHKMVVQWSDKAHGDNVRIVYLMRRGNWFRIGQAQLFARRRGENAGYSFHLHTRARIEGAEALWILYISTDAKSVSLKEYELSYRYGIPMTTFNVPSVSRKAPLAHADLHSFHESMSDVVPQRAIKLLGDLGLCLEYPFYSFAGSSNGYMQQGLNSRFVVRAANLLSEYMTVPVYSNTERQHGDGEEKPDWTELTVTKHDYDGLVYSLNVEPWHYYVQDEIVVGNCIFSFKGASADNFIFPEIPEEQKTFLRQSWRVPRVVQQYAKRWIEGVERREVKEYLPRNVEGEIRFLRDKRGMEKGNVGTWAYPEAIFDDAMDYIARGKHVMLIAPCAYMLEPSIRFLKANGIPFSNKYRPNRPEWNPLVSTSERTASSDRLLAFLRLSEDVWGASGTHIWTPDEFRLWSEVVRAKGTKTTPGVFHRGGKAAFDRQYEAWAAENPGKLSEPMDVYSHLMNWMESEGENAALWKALGQDLEWFASVLQESRVEGMRFPLEVVRKFGARQLMEEPNITLGTIHSVKGGEADAVYVISDLSRAGHDEWTGRRAMQDSIRRLFYVAMTRTKESLIFVKPANGNSVSFTPNL